MKIINKIIIILMLINLIACKEKQVPIYSDSKNPKPNMVDVCKKLCKEKYGTEWQQCTYTGQRIDEIICN